MLWCVVFVLLLVICGVLTSFFLEYFWLMFVIVFSLHFTVLILGCAEEVRFWEGLILSTKPNFLS